MKAILVLVVIAFACLSKAHHHHDHHTDDKTSSHHHHHHFFLGGLFKHIVQDAGKVAEVTTKVVSVASKVAAVAGAAGIANEQEAFHFKSLFNHIHQEVDNAAGIAPSNGAKEQENFHIHFYLPSNFKSAVAQAENDAQAVTQDVKQKTHQEENDSFLTF